MIVRDLRNLHEITQKREVVLWDVGSFSEKEIHRTRRVAYMILCASALVSLISVIHVASAGIELQSELVEEAKRGFESIAKGTNELSASRTEKARDYFKQAGGIFKTIGAQTWFTAGLAGPWQVNDPAFEAAHSVVTLGSSLARAGEVSSGVYGNLSGFGKKLFEAQGSGIQDAGLGGRASLTEALKKEKTSFAELSSLLDQARSSFNRIPTSFIPSSLREKVSTGGLALDSLTTFIGSAEQDLPALLTLFGDEHPHTILVLLQNNAELRPSGGFIGNYMIVETNDGYITKSEVFDVYSADHQLKEVITPPDEIAAVSSRWFMRDANYSGHFPLSAEKVAWFLEKEGGPGVDTIIAIDEWWAREILRFTGPVTIPELKSPITSATFSSIVSYVVESKISGAEDPKKILRSLLPAVQSAVFSRVDPVTLLPSFNEAVASKHLLAYSKNAEVQSLFERYGMAGLMKKPGEKEDYLSVIHTSIGGNKSDRYVQEELTHTSYISDEGSVVNELVVSRTHGWDSAVEKALIKTVRAFGFTEISPEVMSILGRSPSKHMLRVYVPLGSVLESSSVEDTKTVSDFELSMTYFSLPIEVPVGKTAEVRVRYRLPFELDLSPVDNYRLHVYKQPGQNDVSFVKKLVPDDSVLLYTHSPDTGFADGTGAWKFEMALDHDVSFTSVVGR